MNRKSSKRIRSVKYQNRFYQECRIYIYLLYEIFEKQSDSTDAQQQEAPVDESREVVEARTPGEQTIPRTMTSVRRKDGPRLKEILV